MTAALIADDEPQLALYLRDRLARLWPQLRLLPPVHNGLEAAEQIATQRPELAFLDIQMPGLTGLEVAQGIEGPTRVVFVTAYDEYAVQAFDQAAMDYLLKPVTEARLARTVTRLQAVLSHPSDDEARLAQLLQKLLPAGAPLSPPLRYLRASGGEFTHQIDVDQVLFFRADDKYTCVQTADAEYLIRTPIAELAGQLDAQQFWQVHRSTIVNLKHLAGTRRDEVSRLFVRLKGWPHELPVSRAYVHLFKAM